MAAAWSRRIKDESLVRSAGWALLLIAAVGVLVIAAVTPVIIGAIPFARATRNVMPSVCSLTPISMLLSNT